MNNNKIRIFGAAAVGVIWLVLVIFAWVKPADEISEAERRKLAQFPELTVETILDGKFMANFEDYTLDQFPLRDSFRQIKSLFHYNVMQQSTNNNIYLEDGYAAKLEYPLNETSMGYALNRFNSIYNQHLKTSGCKVYMAIAPDKGYYLAEPNGYLAMDYEQLFSMVQEGMPWATFVDLTDTLDITDYYYTDTHWRS